MNRVPKTKNISHRELTEYMFYESGDFQTILKVDSLNNAVYFYERVAGELIENLKPLNLDSSVLETYDKIAESVAPGVYTFDAVFYNGHQLHIVDLLSWSGVDIESYTYVERLEKLLEIFVNPLPPQVSFKIKTSNEVNNKLEMYKGTCESLIVKELVSLKYNMDYRYVTPPKVYKIVGCAEIVSNNLTTDVVLWRRVATELKLNPGDDPSKISSSCKADLVKIAKRKKNDAVRKILTVKNHKRVYLVADSKNLIFGYYTTDDNLLNDSPTMKECPGYTWMMTDYESKFINIRYFKTCSIGSFNHKSSGKEMYKLQLNRLICEDSERVVVSNLPVHMRIIAARLSKSNLSSLTIRLMENLKLIHFDDDIEEFNKTIKMLEDLLDRMDKYGGGGSIVHTTLPKKRPSSSNDVEDHSDEKRAKMAN